MEVLSQQTEEVLQLETDGSISQQMDIVVEKTGKQVANHKMDHQISSLIIDYTALYNNGVSLFRARRDFAKPAAESNS